MVAILVFFVSHWVLSVFCQTFFLHRYGAHRMFEMSKGWERFFHFCTFVFQGSSYLSPRAYAILHREHHAFSDGPRDPHSPHTYTNLYSMLKATWLRYAGIRNKTIQPEARFEGGYPEWPALDRWAHSWVSSLAWGTAYTLFYIAFAPHWAFYALLPVHYLMGPVHGSIVNWCGHKYGYRNYDTGKVDKSKNTLIFDFLTLGELFQNNHHAYGSAPNFAVRRFEIDPAWQVMKVFHRLGIIDLGTPQKMTWQPGARTAHNDDEGGAEPAPERNAA